MPRSPDYTTGMFRSDIDRRAFFRFGGGALGAAATVWQGETHLVLEGGSQDDLYRPPFQGELQRMRRFLEGHGLRVTVFPYSNDFPPLRGCISSNLLIHSRFLPVAVGDGLRSWLRAKPDRLIVLCRPGLELHAYTGAEMDHLCRYL